MPGRSEKISKTDPGITVDGVPLETIIEAEEKKEKANDLEDTRKQEIGAKTKGKKKVKPRERYEADPRKVSKRVRRLSDWEIRKEYGVKQKPFPSLTKNVMYCIYNAGDTLINSRDVSKLLDKPLPDVSSALSNVYKKLKNDGMIYRKKVGLAYQYCMTNEGLAMGFEELYIKYFPGPGGTRKKTPPSSDPIAPDLRAAAAVADKELAKVKPITQVQLQGDLAKLKKDFQARLDGLFLRIEQVETDGLADQVDRIDNQLSLLENHLKNIEVSGTAPTNEFTINVRFLFGRA